jgi:His Kinase A (phospho-acceptor) domain
MGSAVGSGVTAGLRSDVRSDVTLVISPSEGTFVALDVAFDVTLSWVILSDSPHKPSCLTRTIVPNSRTSRKICKEEIAWGPYVMDWTAVILGSAIGIGLNVLRPKGNLSPRDSASCPTPDSPPSPAYQAALDLAAFKSSFLSRTSHELRSPMNALISSLQLISADLCDSPEEEREYVGIAHDAALKFIGLLDEVIKVSKLQTGSLPVRSEVVDLSFLLQEVYFMTRLQAENRNLKLIIPLLDEELLTQADEAYLRQALVILVDRAISILDEGTIEVVMTQDVDRIYLTLPDPDPSLSFTPTPSPKAIPTTFSPEFRLLLAQEILSVMQIPLTINTETRSIQMILPRIGG